MIYDICDIISTGVVVVVISIIHIIIYYTSYNIGQGPTGMFVYIGGNECIGTRVYTSAMCYTDTHTHDIADILTLLASNI